MQINPRIESPDRWAGIVSGVCLVLILSRPPRWLDLSPYRCMDSRFLESLSDNYEGCESEPYLTRPRINRTPSPVKRLIEEHHDFR